MVHKFIFYVSCILIIGFYGSCTPEKTLRKDDLDKPYFIEVPKGFPQPYSSTYNPMTVAGVELGKSLFGDPILSSNGMTCLSCHKPELSYSSGIYTDPLGNKISVPPHINLAFNPDYNWDGGVNIDTLALGDFSPVIFNTNADSLFNRIANHPFYPYYFKKVFGIDDVKKLSYDQLKRYIAKALSQYMRSKVSANSLYDQYKNGKVMVSPEVFKGMTIFFTEKGDCFHCHGEPLFTDNQFHNNGLNSTFSKLDQGRFLITKNLNDMGKFSTPTLRNIAYTAPYMHDGSLKTLEDVVEFYNSGVRSTETIDPIMTKANKANGLGLTNYEKYCLVEFLKSLSDSSFVYKNMRY